MLVTVPSHRASKDISIQEDIAEEIVRVIGYDEIPLIPLPVGQGIISKNQDKTLRDLTLSHFMSRKWHEVYTYSFTSASLDSQILMHDMTDAVRVRNAFNEEYTHMRRSLAPRILLSISENLKHRDAFSFFEIGKVYSKNRLTHTDNPLTRNIAIQPFPEKKMIAGASVGSTIEALRDTIESYLHDTLGYVPPVHTGTSLTLLHPGMSGRYMEGDTALIEFGVLHPEVATAFGVPTDTLYFEIDFREILARYAEKDVRFHPISRYQTITRELNFIMDTHTPTAEVARIIDAVHPWIGGVIVDSIYEDETKI